MELQGRSITAVTRHLPNAFKLDRQISFESVTGTVRHIVDIDSIPFRIEFFRLSDDPHDQERFRRRRVVVSPMLRTPIHVATAEDVIIMKLRWAISGKRLKNHDDIRDVVAVQADLLDWEYIAAGHRSMEHLLC